MNESIENLMQILEVIDWYDVTNVARIDDASIAEMITAGHGDVTSVGPYAIYMLITYDNDELILIMETHIHKDEYKRVPVTQERLIQFRASVTVCNRQVEDA